MLQAVILIVIIAAVLIWLRRASEQTIAHADAPAPARAGFHCVEVRAGPGSCEAAWRLGTVRFLSGEAPQIPLAACDARPCTCRYIHYNDRRADERRHPYGHWAGPPAGLAGERRHHAERRQGGARDVSPSIGY